MLNHFGLLDTDVMLIFMIIALDIIITMRFSINCSAVICSPTVIHAILREATSETYGPRVYLPHIIFLSTSYFCCRLFCNLYFSIYTTKIPKIFILLSLSDLTFASGREGIDNPFIALVARFLIVCAGTRDLRVVSYWIDTLVLKNRGKYLRYFAGSPFPIQGKTDACSRGSKKDFWRRCQGDLRISQDIPSTH